jgi:hypothetical protein
MSALTGNSADYGNLIHWYPTKCVLKLAHIPLKTCFILGQTGRPYPLAFGTRLSAKPLKIKVF